MRFLYALVRPILCGSVCQICCGSQHHPHDDSDHSPPQFQCGQVYSFDGAPYQYPACDSGCLCKLLNDPAFLFSSYELLNSHVSPLMLSLSFCIRFALPPCGSIRLQVLSFFLPEVNGSQLPSRQLLQDSYVSMVHLRICSICMYAVLVVLVALSPKISYTVNTGHCHVRVL